MFSIDVSHNIKQTMKRFRGIEKQIPFATAKALTRTAQDVQRAEIANVQRVFSNKKKWFGKNQPTGIKITPAKKNNLTAFVYSNASFLQLHETGGIKTPSRGNSLAVPTINTPKRLRKSGGVRKAMNQKKTFIGSIRGGQRGVLKRTGKKPYPLKVIFGFEPKVKIKKALGFALIGTRVASRQFQRHFDKALIDAQRTAR